MNITIKVIPHNHQRYETVGDWYFKDGNLFINVSEMGNWRYECLVAFHELCEVLLCKDRRISQNSVDQFDKKYEKDRKEDDCSEPGDDPRAPYRDEHCAATGMERLLASMLLVSWKMYEEKLNSL